MTKLDMSQQPEPVYAPVPLMYLKYVRKRQQSVLMLQHCAILSQQNRHQLALDLSLSNTLIIKEITKLGSQIIQAKRDNQNEKLRYEKQKDEINNILN